MNPWKDQLETLLSEDISVAIERERTTFQRLAGAEPLCLVLFGAGGLGRWVLAGLRRAGVTPRAFADNDPGRWGTMESGLPVLSPAEAVAQFGTAAVFVVTVWNAGPEHRTGDLCRQLEGLGCKTVVSVGPLFWNFPEIFLPHCYIDLPHKALADKALIRNVFASLTDTLSQGEFVSQVRCRLRGDFPVWPHPVSDPQYWPRDIITFSDDEYFVDCGAFDGDTIRELFRSQSCGLRELAAFEPDPINFMRLQESVKLLDARLQTHIHLYRAAVGSAPGKLHFNANASVSSAVVGADGPSAKIESTSDKFVEVQCVTLDDVLQAAAPTYIKMDVEGYELVALSGARNLITRYHPVLAICAYHVQDHLWRIPALIKSFWDGYRIHFRVHASEGDLVCYAVPPSRRVASG